MNWVGCLNHNLTNDTSEKPSESPTATATTEKCGTKQVGLHPYGHWAQ
jgi:hypothetical protein